LSPSAISGSTELERPTGFIDLTTDNDRPDSAQGSQPAVSVERENLCNGLLVLQVHEGQNPYLGYPFALHGEKRLGWHIRIDGNGLTVQALRCDGILQDESEACQSCRELMKGGYLPGIVERMKEREVHENTPLLYHGPSSLIAITRRKDRQIRSMRLVKLNLERKMVGFTKQLDDCKRLHVAIASGKVKNVDLLIRVALNNKRSVGMILRRYCDAAAGVYNARDMSEQAKLKGILLWRMAGVRVAEFAHRALGLPSLSVLRRESTMLPILPSPGFPTSSEVAKNVQSIFTDGLVDALKATERKTFHFVLMLDEIATEKRLRWDDRTNYFLGLCREHSGKTSIVFESEHDVNDVVRCVKEQTVHYATEVRTFTSPPIKRRL
jgi:hypothetical protein